MMLDSHPDLAIPFETHFLPALFAQVDPPLTSDMFFERVVSSPGWPNMAIANEQFRQRLDNIEPFDTVSGVRAFFLMCAERFGKQRWGDKTPAYLHQMIEIQERLPEAHFIHIIHIIIVTFFSKLIKYISFIHIDQTVQLEFILQPLIS